MSKKDEFNYLRRMMQLTYIMRHCVSKDSAISLSHLQSLMEENGLSKAKYTSLISRGKKDGYIIQDADDKRLYITEKSIEVLDEVKKIKLKTRSFRL